MTSGRTSSTRYHRPAGKAAAAVRSAEPQPLVTVRLRLGLAALVDAAMRGPARRRSTRQPPIADLNSSQMSMRWALPEVSCDASRFLITSSGGKTAASARISGSTYSLAASLGVA